MAIELTRDQWRKFAPGCPDAWTDALLSNIGLLRGAGILQSELRWCHFAGTVYQETGDFREIRENMSYRTPSVLRSTWPSRFGHKTDAELEPLLRNPKRLAEAVYGGRMGNRPGTSDAYDTRGGGWLQTTGYGSVCSYCEKAGMPYHSGVLDDPVATLKFAVIEWTETKCNDYADHNDVVKVAKVINTGSATSNVVPIGLAERRRAFARAWKIWGESGEADCPAKEVSMTSVAAKVGAPAAAAATVINQFAADPSALTAKLSAYKELTAVVTSFGPWMAACALAIGAVFWIRKGQ